MTTSTEKRIRIKFVRAANAWCRTTIWIDKEGYHQKQEWFPQKPKS